MLKFSTIHISYASGYNCILRLELNSLQVWILFCSFPCLNLLTLNVLKFFRHNIGLPTFLLPLVYINCISFHNARTFIKLSYFKKKPRCLPFSMLGGPGSTGGDFTSFSSNRAWIGRGASLTSMCGFYNVVDRLVHWFETAYSVLYFILFSCV